MAEPEPTDKPSDEKVGHPASKLIIAGILVVVVATLSYIYYLQAKNFVSTDDAFTASHIHSVGARVAGTILSVEVEANHPVAQGDVLLRIDPVSYQNAVVTAEAALALRKAGVSEAEAAILKAKAGHEAALAQIEQGAAEVSRATAGRDNAGQENERAKKLFNRDAKAISQRDFDAKAAALDMANAQLEAARADLSSLRAQATAAKAGVAAAQASKESSVAMVKSAEAQLAKAKLQLSYCTVVAPVAGKVMRGKVESGQGVAVGQALMAVVPEEVWVIANLKETQLGKVRVGQPVEIVVDAIPSHEFRGRVESFQEGSGSTFALLPSDNATGNFTKIVQRVPVKIVFDEDSIAGFQDRLLPGLSVEPKIDVSPPSGETAMQQP